MHKAMISAISAATGAAILLVAGAKAVTAPEPERPMVRIAELEIDPDHLNAYKAILAEEQEASVRLEPGVLMLHSVALQSGPRPSVCSKFMQTEAPMRRTSSHLTS